MENLVINIMNDFGYIGTFLLIMVENLFPPIPSEIILTFGGFMTKSTEMTILGVVIASTLGSLLGALILYYIGKLLNKERLVKIIKSKYGKLLQIKEKDIDKANSWFEKKGRKTVFFCRFIPIVRSLISIPAGMNEMPIIKFLVYTFIGSGIWNTALIFLGRFAYEKKDLIYTILDNFKLIVLVILLMGMLYLIYKFYNTRNNKKVKKDSNE